MPEKPVIQKTRKELYDEIWEISVAGLAKKYDVPYAHMMKQIKEADIPIPASGYWTKLSHGKPVTVIELTGNPDETVSIYRTAPGIQKRKTISPQLDENKFVSTQVHKTHSEDSGDSDAEVKTDSEHTEKQHEPEVREHYGQKYNVYDREVLYREVWEQPVTEIAKKYMVSDVTIHKVCKSLVIPTPPAGYWAKLRAGKAVKKIPLPQGDYINQKEGLRLGVTDYSTQSEGDVLSFLDDENRAIILSVAEQILLPDANARMHSKIIAHRNKVIEWQKQLKSNQAKGWGKRTVPEAPLLADTVAVESLPRVCRIFDALIKALEPLGCTLSENLRFTVNGETVFVSVSESTDKVNHIPTTEENYQLLKYEEDRRTYSYASKPTIRKYDYPYNGKLCFTVQSKKSFRDCKSYAVEERLGALVIALYEASDIVRQEREAREEAERQRQAEARLREERRERYNREVEETNALINAAEDYEIACKIRAYVAAVEASGKLNEDKLEWIAWAKKKADWYDPVMALEDEILGVRKHDEKASSKELEKSFSSWRW